MTARSLVVVQIATSGLDPREHVPLEIAAAALRPAESTIADAFGMMVLADLEKLAGDCSEEVWRMHDDSGLLADLAEYGGMPRRDVDVALAKWIDTVGGSRSPLIAWSADFAAGFLAEHFPLSFSRFSKDRINVSALLRAFGVRPSRQPRAFEDARACAIQLNEIVR